MGMQHLGNFQKAFDKPNKHFERPDHSIFYSHQNEGECKCAVCQLNKFHNSQKSGS